MILTYQEALNYLYDNLPMFQRVGPVAFKKDLTNTLRLCSILGNPQNTFRSVHVGGTNGKGSTSHMLASVLQASGYKTGLYTSPHLKEFTERIRIDGKEVSQDFVVEFVSRIRPAIEAIKPSFFEITVAMAFDYFARNSVDIAVVEVGLGGRLDSTNVITPLLSVITNISWDHKELLGDTLAAIASEKAGIIKTGIPVVVSERQREVEDVFISKARSEGSEIYFASDEYSVRLTGPSGSLDARKGNAGIFKDVPFPLHGLYQERNVAGVLKSVEILRRHFSISTLQLEKGLSNAVANTGLKGRWQILMHSPTVVCDTAHNPSGVSEVLRQIGLHKFGRLFVIWGMVRDKDVSTILSLLPREAIYYFCQARIPRAMEASTLAREAAAFGLRGEVVADVNEAMRSALARASADDFIFIGGSTYVVAEIEEL